jgi:catechol 2,3-dioxygenase-like lactoylglutathione lyase family enzyme
MSRVTHIAYQVTDVDRTVRFYERYTAMRVVEERTDHENGSKVVWLRESKAPGPLTIVLFTGRGDHSPGNTFHHLGISMSSRADVDRVAERAAREGTLAIPPEDHGGEVGYICGVSDPDGNLVEFSFGQRL